MKNSYLDFLKTVLLEGQNEEMAKSLLKKNGLEKNWEELLKITEPYKNTPQGKNNKHLPILVRFMIQDSIDLETLHQYYLKFINNSKINMKPIDKMNFKEFEKLVDNTKTTISKIQISKDLEKPYYEDENIEVYYADTKEKAIQYGRCKKDYGFCISRKAGGNIFDRYRADGATFYFVFFKVPQEKAPEGFIVIHAYRSMYKINYAIKNEDIRIKQEEITNQFPVITQELLDKAIKFVPHSEKEKHLYSYIKNQHSILDLKSRDEQLLYIDLGKHIKDDEWVNIATPKEIIEQYIEVGEYDLPDEFEQKFPDQWKRYLKKLEQRVDARIDDNNKNFTRHETIYVINKRKDLLQMIAKDDDMVSIYAFNMGYKNIPLEILQKIAQRSTKSLFYAEKIGFKDVPQEILRAIGSDPKTSIEYAKKIGFKDVPQEIEKGYGGVEGISQNATFSLEYAQAVGFKNVPPEIEKAYGGIKEIAKTARNSYQYAQAFGFKNTPLIILRGIAKSPEISFTYAKKLGFKNVPPQMIKTISGAKWASLEYAKNLEYKNVPRPIINTILKSDYKDNLPKDYTIDDNWDKPKVEESCQSFSKKLEKVFT